MTDFQRTEIALKMKPLIEVKAKENQGARTDILQNFVKSSTIHTGESVAEIAGVSRETVRKVEKIQQQAAPFVVKMSRFTKTKTRQRLRLVTLGTK